MLLHERSVVADGMAYAKPWVATEPKTERISEDRIADNVEDALATAMVAKHWPKSPAHISTGISAGWIFADATPRDLHMPLNYSGIYSGAAGARWFGVSVCPLRPVVKKSLRLTGDWYTLSETFIGASGRSYELSARAEWTGHAFLPKEVVCGVAANRLDSGTGGINRFSLVTKTSLFKILCGAAFAIHYNWRAVIMAAPNRGIILDSDAAGIREFFSDREVTEGASRRDALRHWVRKHKRRSRCSDSDASDCVSWVKKHLRGKTDFQWHGLDCRLEVAPAQIQEMAS